MKNIKLFIFAFLSLSIQAQTYRMNENDKKAIIRLSPDIYNATVRVESSLNNNVSRINDNNFDLEKPYLNSISGSYETYGLSKSKINKIESILCLKCYESEWNKQLDLKTVFSQKKQMLADSLENIRVKELSDLKSAKNKEVQYVALIDKDKPYDLLQRSLYAFSKTNRSLVVFRGLDYNYSAPSLSGYLQSEMGLGSKDFKVGESEIAETFIPKVSKGGEFLTVRYFISKRKDIVGIYDSEEVSLINSVEITGTPEIIINLFLNFWPQKIKFGGYKKGEIAYQELLGDKISIIGVSPNLYKIKIDKGNVEVNYLETYGINKKR